MKRVKLSELRSGMTAARDVAAPQGPVLARTGTTLTPRHLKAFRAWGVRDLCVMGEAGAGAGARPPDLGEAAVRLTHRFRAYDLENLVHQEVFRLALRAAGSVEGETL